MTVQGSMVAIDSQDVKLPAYVTKPAEAKGPSAGVIIIHDWWGLGNYVKKVADRLGSAGYVGIAPDLYLGKLAANPDEARKLSSEVAPTVAKKFLDVTITYLSALDVAKVGIMGFCFGGTVAFNYLCDSKDLRAGVMFYATHPPSEEQLRNITAPLLIIYGDQDHSVEPEQAKQLELTLKSMGKDATLLMYAGAPHAFFNDENKQNYRPEAAKDAWEKTVEFLNPRLLQDWNS
jgi:carboxymethylenebutenolidase